MEQTGLTQTVTNFLAGTGMDETAAAGLAGAGVAFAAILCLSLIHI